MEWQLKTAAVSDGIVTPRVLIQGAIPAFLCAGGRYAEFVSDSGESNTEYPHVEVLLAETMHCGPSGRDCWIGHIYINAVGVRKNGRQRILPVVRYQECQPARNEEEIAALVDNLAPQIAEAVALCGRLDAVFEEAAQRTSMIGKLRGRCTTRAGYEVACSVAGVESLSDEE